MTRIKISLTSLAVIASVVASLAFRIHTNKQVFEYGITGTTGSGPTLTYLVEPFASTGSCNSSTSNCSFDYPTSGKTEVLASDPNITSLVTQATYSASGN